MKKTKKLKRFYIVVLLFLQFFVATSFLYIKLPSANYAVSHALSSGYSAARAMAVIESSTGRVLYSHNKDQRLPMASTTKILTAIVAIESTEDLDKKHEIDSRAVGIEGSSIYLRAGEHLSIRELLYGLMLRSGNDSAVAIAIIVAGSVENFVDKMNELCNKLSLKNTNIVTVNGLHNDRHYTSAHDLAVITAYALKNPVFAEIVSTKFKTIDNELAKGAKLRYLKNKNKLLSMVDGADGVKTGYTKKAGRCFVGSATRNNMQVICVLLDCPPMFEECSDLIERAFKEYRLTKLMSAGEITMADVKNGKTQKVPILIKKDILYPLKTEEIDKISAKIILNSELSAPLSEGEVIGQLQLKLQNDLIFSEKLYTISVEVQPKYRDYLKNIIRSF